uniref:Kinesin-like protein n=1 Tax=Ascaris lumbricoides TaxID=6252 RepID=A0A9J2PFE7_ASCLU
MKYDSVHYDQFIPFTFSMDNTTIMERDAYSMSSDHNITSAHRDSPFFPIAFTTTMSARKRAATPSRRCAKRLDDKEAVEVVCRICPYSGSDPCAVVLDEEHVKLVPPAVIMQRNGIPAQETVYKFSYVFDESDSQRVVFERSAVDLIENLVRGRNSLLFTYGVTGSGKTYTMTGNTTEASTGILPRTLDVIFNSLPNRVDRCVFCPDGRNGFDVRSELEAALARRRLEINHSSSIELTNRYVEHKRVSGANDNMLCAVFVSYIEVYNDVCYDLLDEPVVGRDGTRMLVGKEVRLGVNNMVYVENAIEVEVDSSDEALELFCRGQERRRVGDTLLNKKSSRSHSIFNIRLVMAPCRPDVFHPETDPARIHVSQLSLVDLAGSERTKRTGNEGARLVESGKINQSLLVLRQCFEKLRENQRSLSPPVPVPYRESKITHLFKNYFEGSGKIRMIVCINPRPNDYAENLAKGLTRELPGISHSAAVYCLEEKAVDSVECQRPKGVMSFAELSQSIEVVRGAEVALPAGDGLPISRREYIKWIGEIENLVPRPMRMNLFDAPPSFELMDSDDTESITRLRVFYQSAARKRDAYIGELEGKENDYEAQLRRALCLADVQLARIKELESERDEAERSLGTLMAQLKQSRRENQALRHRIGRYEAEEYEKASQEEEHRRRERGYQEQLRKKEKTLHQVREIFERPPSTRKQYSSTENVSRIELGQSNEQLAGPSGCKPSLKHTKTTTTGTPSGTVYPSLLAERQNLEQVRGRPQVMPKPGFYNARYHRRSKSAGGRVIDHQPRVRIPEGTYMQVGPCELLREPTRIPGAPRTTTRVEIGDLKKSHEYVLTHQEVDSEGNLMTRLVKGDCIPTAGGGTAVRFNDVERLCHESPDSRNPAT